jgi:flagellar secretion chaperone FliS
MFSPAYSFGNSRPSARAYHQVGVETGVAAASPHALTLMLLDGLLGAIKQARQALAEGRVADKGHHIRHAARILDEGLKSSLNLQAGGELAMNLRDLYDYVQMRLLHANLRNDDAALQETLRLITPVREGWAGISATFPA